MIVEHPSTSEHHRSAGTILRWADARGWRSARPPGPDGDPGVAPRGAHRAGTAPSSRSPSRIARWDHLLIRRGLDALARAEALGGDSPYVLQAALAACHARARRAADTDRPRIAALYDRLRVVAPSPVVDLNRAIAHSMAFGPEAGLKLVDEIADADALRNYAPLPAARGDFLFRAGRLAEARSEFKAAATLTRNVRERAFLLARADACDGQR